MYNTDTVSVHTLFTKTFEPLLAANPGFVFLTYTDLK